MTMARPVPAWRAAALAAALIVALATGCGRRQPVSSASESAAALSAVVGPLPAGLEILFHEQRGELAAGWIVRTPKPWKPHEAVDHRHATLPVDTFMNLVAATSGGTLDLGRPTDDRCRYTEWRMPAAEGTARRDIRIHQLTTEQGECTVLETLPDPAGG